MAEAILYIFPKRKNSTKIPTGGAAINVELKGGASILEPVFLLNYAAGVPTFNMVKFENRYYFVNSIRSVRANLYELACSVDVLATYKTDILNMEAFVEYDTTANTELIDNRLAPLTSVSVRDSGGVKLTDNISITGSELICVTGENSVGVYKLAPGHLKYFMPDITTVYNEFVEGEDPFAAINAAGKQLIGSGSVGQNIRSARWIPFNINPDATVNPVKVGMYTVRNEGGVAIGAGLIGTKLETHINDVSIPWQFNDWRNNAPYTKIFMYIPFVGVIEIAPNLVIGEPIITFKTTINRQTGEISIRLGAGEQFLGTYHADTSMPIPIGSSNINPLNATMGAISAAGAALAGNAVGIAASMISAITPSTISNGGIGGGTDAGNGLLVHCWTVCHNTNQIPSTVNSVMGTPTNAAKSLQNLTGYVQTRDFSIIGNMMDNERETINSMMDGGVYIE